MIIGIFGKLKRFSTFFAINKNEPYANKYYFT